MKDVFLLIVLILLMLCILRGVLYYITHDFEEDGWEAYNPEKKINLGLQTSRADSLPKLDQTEDVEVYINFTCRNCRFFDNHDMCLCKKHYGTIIQNTVEYCKRDNNFKKNKIL